MSEIQKQEKKRVIIMGAAGRDFHNFNVYFRDNPQYDVVAFTATQIPGIEGRNYPAALTGKLYPKGIPIHSQENLTQLIRNQHVSLVVYSLSDVSHTTTMHAASEVLAAGADFLLLGPNSTMLNSSIPVVSVCAVRTGSGKSQTTRKAAEILRNNGLNPVVVRHPMPYGDLSQQICQRYEAIEDMDKYNCTIEEREEYEPHIEKGTVVYAGVDYEVILREAEKEADVILWDGGNNDLPFYRPDLHIVIADPHRPGHEISYHPGEANLRMADVVIINKIKTAQPSNVVQVRNNIQQVNPNAVIIDAASPITLDEKIELSGLKVLVVEDGPTITHGEMPYGAGAVIAKRLGATLVDPRPHAVGSIKSVYTKYKHLGSILPAMGYSDKQILELENTINATPCDLVIIGTPIDLRRVASIGTKAVRVRYNLEEVGNPNLEDVLKPIIERVENK